MKLNEAIGQYSNFDLSLRLLRDTVTCSYTYICFVFIMCVCFILLLFHVLVCNTSLFTFWFTVDVPVMFVPLQLTLKVNMNTFKENKYKIWLQNPKWLHLKKKKKMISIKERWLNKSKCDSFDFVTKDTNHTLRKENY